MRPMTAPSWSTLVNVMLGRAARGVLSYPAIEISPGTDSPASCTAASAPKAAWSAPTKMAVGRGVEEAPFPLARGDSTRRSVHLACEMLQVYLRPVVEDAERPRRWLAGSAVAEAAPGATTEALIEIPARAYESWTDHGWHRAHGDHVIEVSHSLTDTQLVIQ